LTTGSTTPSRATFVSQTELALWLEALRKRARSDGSEAAVLLAELQEQERALPGAWFGSAEICALAADACAALEDFAKAVDYYNRIVTAEEACAPISALEQLANCRARWAVALAAGTPPKTAEANEQLQHAEDLLRRLLEIGETSERSSLLGGVMKRRAELSRDRRRRRDALQKMSEAYLKGFQISRQGGGAGDPYPLANHIAAEVVLTWSEGDKGRRTATKKLVTLLEQAESARTDTQTDTFNLIARAERSLLLALIGGELTDAQSGRVQAEFERGLSRGATPRERDSIRTQFRFFRTMAGAEFPQAGREKLISQLSALEKNVLG
jgi:tetratricopeptide (TPR) repeat protein